MRSPVDAVAARLRVELGDDAVVTDHARLRTYECDGLAYYKVVPALVVLPRTTAEVAAVSDTPQEQESRQETAPHVARSGDEWLTRYRAALRARGM